MKVKFSAVIPVVDFGNVQPEIELEGEDYEKLQEEGMTYIVGAWNKYGKNKFPDSDVEKHIKKEVESRVLDALKNFKEISGNNSSFEEFDTFTGEKILYDDAQHLYTDLKGNKLISGSEYAKGLIKPFDLELLSGKVSMKYEIPKEIVKKMWSMSGDISATFGTALHMAMEQWFLHKEFGTEKEYHLPKPEYLKKAVLSFPLKDADILPEVMISDVENKMCGQIDGLNQILNDDSVSYTIIDYKSDSDVKKNLTKHTIQLNFYRKILENKGFTISGMSIWNYVDEKWTEYQIERINLEI